MKGWRLLGTKLLAFFLIMLTGALAQTLPRETREQIIRATVLIVTDGGLGSGTIISPQGYVLTNYHVVGNIENRTFAPQIKVGVIRFVDQPPRMDYIAEVVEGDPNLDLAIIRITRTANGQPIGNMTFPAVPVGDSNKLIVGDPIYAFGFQGTGGLTISFSGGTVGGFTGEDMLSGGKQWIKHDAQTGPGNSGGGVYNQNGELIGIHTAGKGGGGNSRTAFMRPSALAWGLISPNVQGLVRPGATASNPSVQQPSPTPQASSSSRPRVVSTGQLLRVEVRGGSYTGDWVVQIGNQNKDGDFDAVATQGSRKIDVFIVLDNNFVAIGPFTGNNQLPHFCRLTAANNGFTDGRLFEIRDRNTNQVGTCNVALATVSTNLPWPPYIATGETFQVNMRVRGYSGSWNVRIGNKDKDNDYLMAISEGGSEVEGAVIIRSNSLIMGFFYINQVGHVCLLSEQRASGTYQGIASEIRNNNLVDVGTCTITPTRNIGSSGTTAPAPVTISWPPRFAVGQVWQITAQGQYVGTWNIQVGQRDDRGNYEATATQGSRQKSILIAITPEGFGMGYLSFDEPNPYFCMFQPQSPATALQGKLVQSRNGNTVDIGSCRLTLVQNR